MLTAQKGRTKPRTSIPCAVCGVAYQPRPEGGKDKFCSEGCRIEERRRRTRADYRARNPLPEGRRCLRCGDVLSQSRNKSAIYCSMECYREARNAKPRQKIPLESLVPGEPPTIVGRDYIIERDGGRCHLCGEECDPQAGRYDPKRIHLDHLIPLAAGGTHTAANIRVACASCNWSKNARARNDQLMLFG